MGMARKASSSNRWANWFKLRQNTPKGAPVPGTGKRRYRKHSSGSNKSGSLNKLNGEWSPEGRKREDSQRGINNRARQQNIAEQVAEVFEDDQCSASNYRPEDNWENELIYLDSDVMFNGVPFDQDW